MSSGGAEVPFTFLCSLFREISRVKSRRANEARQKPKPSESPALQIFKRWFNALNDKFGRPPEELTAAVLRLVFPEEDAKRRYMMQEARLIQRLARCYGVDAHKFTQWAKLEGSGCLGDEVRVVLEQSNSRDPNYIGPLSILQVDALLTELASHCPFSEASVRSQKSSRSQADIFIELFRDMSPEDASYLTQILLRDLRPLLYPLAETDSTAALMHFNTRAVTKLTKNEVLRAWNPSILSAYRAQADFDRAAKGLALEPQPGVVIDVPKSLKGQGCRHSLNFFRSSHRVWAETKYDGERTQIHVTGREIKIFSKSKRDSTLDRKGVHDVILQALGDRFMGNVILDAEMVAFDGNRVDEFWRIRRLINSTAEGIRHNWVKTSHEDSQVSLASDDLETRRLGLVFFDILVLDSRSLLSTPYYERRGILESLIQPSPGSAILAERFSIEMNGPDPELALTRIFAEQIADFQEGLVLKAEESRYNDYKLPWVKFKRDYIPGYGDTVDLVLVGASWEKERARELRVGPKTLTTFYFGAVDKSRKGPKPHIEVLFTSSYGLTREKLEHLNLLIRSSDTVGCPVPNDDALSYFTFNLFSGLRPPSILLQRPLLVELYGAGFTKAPQCPYYELRWPRITKVFRSGERGWKEGVDLQKLQKIAYESVGRDTSDKEIDNCVREMFGKPMNPSVRCPKRRQAVAEKWEELLYAMDGRKKPKRKGLEGRPVAAVSGELPSKRRLPEENRMLASKEAVSQLGHGTPAKRRKVQGNEAEQAGDEEWFSPAKGRDPSILPLRPVTNTIQADAPHSQAPKTSPPSSQRLQNGQNIAGSVLVVPRPAPMRQLPTPSTSPIRQLPAPAQSTSEARELPGEAEQTGVPEQILQEAHVAFVRFGGSKTRCETCSRLKKLVSKDRRIHVVESLLTACGWAQPGVTGAYVERGAVVVDGASSEADVKALLDRLQTRECDGGGERKHITIIMCDGPVYEFR